MSDWKVGDEVVVTGTYVRTGLTTITKVGRKYFYVENNTDTPFQISDGHEKPDGYGGQYKARARTPEQYEADRVRSGVLDKLRKHGVSWSNSWNEQTFREKSFSTARLFELLHLLDNVADDNATTNLDGNTP